MSLTNFGRIAIAGAALATHALPFAQAHSQAPLTEEAMCGGMRSQTTGAATRAQAQMQIDARPASAGAAYLKGCLALADDKADKASDFFEAATKLDPTSSVYFDWLGRSYGTQAQRANKLRQPFLAKKTKAAFEKAVQLDANNLDARTSLVSYYQMAPGFMGGSEEKATEMAEAIKARNAYRGGFVMTTVKNRRKDLVGAEREITALTKSFPDSVQPWMTLVQMQSDAKRWDDAFRTAHAFRAAQPKASTPDYVIGRVASLSGQQLDLGEAAIKRYMAMPLTANDIPLANAHWRLGAIYQAKGAKELARAEYQEAIKLAPTLTEAKAALAALK